MKITKQRLQNIIKEEMTKLLIEQDIPIDGVVASDPEAPDNIGQGPTAILGKAKAAHEAVRALMDQLNNNSGMEKNIETELALLTQEARTKLAHVYSRVVRYSEGTYDGADAAKVGGMPVRR